MFPLLSVCTAAASCQLNSGVCKPFSVAEIMVIPLGNIDVYLFVSEFQMSLESVYLFYITGTGDIIAVMITELRGKDILSYLEKNISVQMTIAVGTRMPPKNFSRGSLVFVSISFIVLMIISSAWLIFYFIQKIRYTNARDRNQVS